MATTNYLKVHRPYRCSVEFFFDSKDPISVASALRAARSFAKEMTDRAQDASDVDATANRTQPKIVDGAAIVVWTHGVRGLGDLHCVGGCELCSPRPDLEIVEAEDDDIDGPPAVALP